MTYRDFLAELKNKGPAVCYLFEGLEEYIKKSMLSELRKHVLVPGLEVVNETVLDNPKPDEIINAVATYPIMEGKRLVVATECGFLLPKKKDVIETSEDADEKADIKQYLQCLSIIPDHSVLVFYVRGNADSNTSVYQKLKQQNAIVLFPSLEGNELAAWVKKTFNAYGKKITEDDISFFLFYAKGEMFFLKNEIEKLVTFACGRDNITKADIKNICTKSLEYSVFDITDAVGAGNTAAAIAYVSNLVKNADKKGYDTLLSMIIRQYRLMYHVLLMKKNKSSLTQIAGVLRLPYYVAEKMTYQTRAYSVKSLKKALDMLIDLDYSIKNGTIANEDAIENAVMLLSRYRTT